MSSGFGKKISKSKLQADDTASKQSRMETTRTNFAAVKKAMLQHDTKVVNIRNARLVVEMKHIVDTMGTVNNPLHKDEFDMKLAHLEELITEVADKLNKRSSKGGGGGAEGGGGGEGGEFEEEEEYQQRQRQLFEQLHSY
tara:strand:- start:326 stop:745 length:420 start_codon:yes stop_codon:yes gene_type:complete